MEIFLNALMTFVILPLAIAVNLYSAYWSNRSRKRFEVMMRQINYQEHKSRHIFNGKIEVSQMDDSMHISISLEIFLALSKALDNSEAENYSELIGSLLRKNEAMRREFAEAEGQNQ
jgi:hypothetical protein